MSSESSIRPSRLEMEINSSSENLLEYRTLNPAIRSHLARRPSMTSAAKMHFSSSCGRKDADLMRICSSLTDAAFLLVSELLMGIKKPEARSRKPEAGITPMFEAKRTVVVQASGFLLLASFPHSPASFFCSNSLSIVGLAWPLVSFIAWLQKSPTLLFCRSGIRPLVLDSLL